MRHVAAGSCSLSFPDHLEIYFPPAPCRSRPRLSILITLEQFQFQAEKGRFAHSSLKNPCGPFLFDTQYVPD